MNLDSSSYQSVPKMSNINGYWLLSSETRMENNARNIWYNTNIDFNSVRNSQNYGIRPVITVLTFDLE